MDRRLRNGLYLIGGIVAAVVILILAMRSGSGDVVLTDEVVRRDVVVSVRAVGRLDAAESTVVSSQIRGDAGKILFLIEDGTRVERGDVLVRLDPTPFEDEVLRLEAVTQENEALVAAQEQILEWEKNQAERDVTNAEFELTVAQLDLERLEKGEGPLELAKLEEAATKAGQEYEEKSRYLADLEELEKNGYAYPAEIAQIRDKIEEASRLHESTTRQFESYRDYVFPTLSKKARARVAQARTDVERTKKGVGFTVGKAIAALREARQKLESSQALLAQARQELEATVIGAPLDGMAVVQQTYQGGSNRKLRVGDVVWQNQPLVYLPSLFSMVVETQVREVDLHKVAVGKPVSVFVDAYPRLRLSGQVESIGVLAEAREESGSSEKYFQVVVSVTGEEPRLRPGMTARVDIESAEARDVLAVPVHAVFHQDGKYITYVGARSNYEMREVTVGIQSEEFVEIVTGLSEGEDVALSRPPADEIHRKPNLARMP